MKVEYPKCVSISSSDSLSSLEVEKYFFWESYDFEKYFLNGMV